MPAFLQTNNHRTDIILASILNDGLLHQLFERVMDDLFVLGRAVNVLPLFDSQRCRHLAYDELCRL